MYQKYHTYSYLGGFHLARCEGKGLGRGGGRSPFILVFKANSLQNLFIVYLFLVYLSISTCFGATMCPSSGETTVFMRHLVLVILCG